MTMVVLAAAANRRLRRLVRLSLFFLIHGCKEGNLPCNMPPSAWTHHLSSFRACVDVRDARLRRPGPVQKRVLLRKVGAKLLSITRGFQRS